MMSTTLLLAPLAAALLTSLLHRWARVAALTGAAATALFWGWLTFALPQVTFAPDSVFAWTEMARLTLQLLLLALLALFLLALVWPPGRDLGAACLAALSPLTAVLLLRSLTWGAVFLVMGVVVLAVAIQAGRSGQVSAAWRYLFMGLLALPFLLTAGWLAETAPGALPLAAARLLALAAIVLLGGFPFYMWVRPVARQAWPLLLPFLLGAVPLTLMAYLFRWLGTQPAWASDPVFLAWLGWSGVATALLGGFLALTAGDEADLWGSLLLVEMGWGLLLLLLPGEQGWETAVLVHQARIVSLFLLGLGWLLLDQPQRLPRGWGERPIARWAGLALATYGGLSLLGLPLTWGFYGRWAVLTTFAAVNPAAAGLALMAVAAGAGGLGRWLWMALKSDA